ncbi:restriction endonuclease [Caproiciproducens sp. NJN-50]|uniref:Eco57I restriction-modification methylase domain-containing protein n=1 Tax=Caproiciproducens sp. NJN-50 TaxID=2507162 RepID=UPI000FFE25B0|nr:Eco57I restriction-modification methylase domain-containing protein [Caproiciproducens sp. NJN-50]QAT49556.1 restriction endonuclease [Caproiciproducens sp. NJN-50]
MADVYTNIYNPDVLSCLANLSNDEVFTPPEIVNQMLDMLPQELFSDPSATFLDPACKSGVFLREIAKRLLVGLAKQIPDRQARIDHIFHKQLFGIAITEITSLLSRRSVYCSKYPNGKYSVTHFDNPEGNIQFKKIKHIWRNSKCVFCGANQSEYDRNESLETHAYEFIHTTHPERIFNMKFDVIIGNPPYQLSDGGAQKSASPLYHKFIQQAKKLKPRYLSMIVPARWYTGGKGLDEFRNEMLTDQHLIEIHDFPETSDCFPGVNIRGGICYFLWSRDSKGDCHITNYKGGKVLDESTRPLLEPSAEVFIRYNRAISILHKVRAFNEKTMDSFVSARKPFGLATNYDGFSPVRTADKDILLYRFGENGYVSDSDIEKNHSWVDGFKVFEPYASPGSDDYPHLVLSQPIIGVPRTACSETYLVIGMFNTEKTANNVALYMKTQFFRFMLMLLKSTQHITQKIYSYVPIQDFNQVWTDEKLYAKYDITKDEQDFIDTLVKPVAWNFGSADDD